ncbi:uncharacterized protein Tco025E_03843 [Trypanosoma conorhini]|uniref:C-type lectin domain-containing protein n=1 Tax=Trypanosoma conorhini TaxID=83891 RepID=A0A3R7L3E3_9TRYP|nr:uncharacterized protein Tco025E_03843 [Trypanosoma conorhini]RNF20271.1 hypothetical protein Tco025E_03843 [Trypanosoma conorhini]
MEDWAYFAPTRRCLRVFTDRSVAAADLEQHCGQLLDYAAADTIHAAPVASVEESAFAGQLVANAGLERALVGVSYIERGVSGLYLDGVTAWEPSLAERLWAVGQPTRESGCVVVDAAGAWHTFPCGTPARAYACAYRAGAVHPPASTPAPTNTTTWPLETRVASLAGAVHLVVAAGTVGTYTVAGAGGSTDGLLLMFAPDLSEVVASVGWSEIAVVSPCGGGYTKQEYIFAVMQGVVTVTHPAEAMRGRVCVSDDGVHYLPAGNLTFEVVDAALRGFIPQPPSPSPEEEAAGGGGGGGGSNRGGGNASMLISQAVGVRLGSSGALRLAVHHRRPGAGAGISRLRFSSSPDCTGGRYLLAGESCVVAAPEPGRPLVTYQRADVVPARGVRLDPAAPAAAAAPTEFFVCVAAFTRVPPPQLSNSSATGWSTRPPHERLFPAAAESGVGYGRGLAANPSSSLSADGQPVRLYTLAPRLRVYVTPPHVALRGMWALPPSGLESDGVFDAASLGPAATTLAVPQFSSPVIVLDGEGLREGMALLLAREPASCARRQPTSGRTPADAPVPAALDTMLAVSTLLPSRRALRAAGVAGQTRVAFVQLNLNHTGLWGMAPGEANLTWHLCFAYTPLSRFVPLAGLKIIVTRARIVAAATHEGHGLDVDVDGDDGSSSSATAAFPQLNIGVGFSGLLRLWGLAAHMWSPSTLNAAEVAFAQSPPGNAAAAEPALQCSNTSLFYRQRSLGIVTPRGTAAPVPRPPPTTGDAAAATRAQLQQEPASVVVIPPGFFNEETTRRMRLCLSVPMPFENSRRVFFPTAATVDVHPVEVRFIGPYAAHFPAAAAVARLTRVEVAENVQDVVLPLFGYGLRDDMLLFLAGGRCHPPVDEAGGAYFGRVSRMNFTILRPYDVPPNYRRPNAARSAAATSDFFIALNITHTAALVADRVFGAARDPLLLCLYAPGTRRAVYPLGFTFVVRRPYITSMRSIKAPSPPQREAAPVAVVYASRLDLVVEGFGLHEGEAAFVPAVDCSNATSFLWRSPVRASGVPSMAVTGDAAASAARYVNPFTSMSSWFLSLTQAQTARIGARAPDGDVVDRFQWCVRYRDADAAADATEWRSGFVPTGIPYRLTIPRTDGFRFGGRTLKRITRKRRHPTLGRWESLQLAGPLISHTLAQGNPLFLFLAEEPAACTAPNNNSLLGSNSSERLLVAVNGSVIILPKLLTRTGTFKLCASAVYPERRPSEEGTEAAPQFFELTGLRIELVDPVYAVFSLNRTDHVTVEQGQHWTLPISGSGLSNMSLVRFRPIGANCSTPMPRDLDDVAVLNVFEGLKFFGELVTPAQTESDEDDDDSGGPHYVVLGRDLIRGLAVREHRLCFKPDRSTPWMGSEVVLNVHPHVRRPTRYAYFSADGSDDVVAATALPPTKLALAWLTRERDTTNIVGAVAREVAVALWCRDGAAPEAAAVVPCGSWRRVMFVRPLDDGVRDRDPCFVDFEANQSATVLGPYVLDDGVLTIPRAVSRNASFYPNSTQPWIMCLETAAERWREPVHPLLQLQYTTATPVGFRRSPDDASNTTATFLGALRRDAGPPQDRTGQEGNRTLTLHMGEESKVFYLNGYGIQRGFMLRFGARCDDGDDDGAAAAAAAQGLNNTLLYEAPLTLEDDHGVFLLPATHFARPEAPTPMCLSTNGGASYARTNLSLTVLPPRLRREPPAAESDIAELAFRRTLVVPRLSKGAVSLANLTADDEDDKTTSGVSQRAGRGRAFAVGTRVLFSSACHESREGLPVTLVTAPGVLTLTEAHTRVATKGRLHMCVDTASDEGGDRGGAGSGAAAEDAGENAGATPLHAFRPSGLFLYVLNVAVTSVSLHQPVPNVVAEQNGIRHLVVRRGAAPVMLLATVETAARDAAAAVGDACSAEERYMRMLNAPGALALFRLAKFQLGRPCGAPDPQQPAASTAAALSALTATFDNNSVLHVATGEGADAVGFAVPLHLAGNETVEPSAPASLCFSVDGGRHYVSVGISYIAVSWAPTLRVRLSTRVEEPEGEAGGNQSVLSSVTHVFEQTSHVGRLVDTRYSTDLSPAHDDPLLRRYLNGFTTDALWCGFLQNAGFASGGELYLPALTIGGEQRERSALLFAVNALQRDIPTGLTLQLEPMALHCIGEVAAAAQQVHRQSTGWLLPIAGACGRSVQSGVTVRLVDSSVSSCGSPAVAAAYVMDVFVMKPPEWAGVGATPTSTALQLPTLTRYVPDGRYKLCVKKYLPYRLGRAAVFLDTAVELEVTSALGVNALAGLHRGLLAVFHGSEAELRVQGSVVPFAEDVCLAFVPVDVGKHHNDADAVCGELQASFDSRGGRGTLPTLWKRVTAAAGGGFVLRLRPRELVSVAPRRPVPRLLQRRRRRSFPPRRGGAVFPAADGPPAHHPCTFGAARGTAVQPQQCDGHRPAPAALHRARRFAALRA